MVQSFSRIVSTELSPSQDCLKQKELHLESRLKHDSKSQLSCLHLESLFKIKGSILKQGKVSLELSSSCSFSKQRN